MKKFKHKESNVEAHDNGTGYDLVINSSHPFHGKCIGKANSDRIEKDDDWIEQIEKDYEILQWRTNCIGHKEKEILKVKRLPDDQVFTVGDNCRGHVIQGFQELNNILWVHFKSASYPISTIDKFPKPEKDYEILEAKDINYDSIWRNPKDSAWQNKVDTWYITKVKRLSDGEVLSVGDVDGKGDIITGFSESSSTLVVKLKRGGYEAYQTLNDVVKRKPILTTNDGVEVFEEAAIPHMRKDDKSWRISNNIEDMRRPHKFIWFSTWEAAEDYRLNHARVLSLIDVRRYTLDRARIDIVKSRL